MKSSKLIKLLQDDGWIIDRVKGSHHILRKEGVDSIISISHPEKMCPGINELKQDVFLV